MNLNKLLRDRLERDLPQITDNAEKKQEVIKEDDKDILVVDYVLYDKEGKEIIIKTVRTDITKELEEIKVKKDELTAREKELLALIK